MKWKIFKYREFRSILNSTLLTFKNQTIRSRIELSLMFIFLFFQFTNNFVTKLMFTLLSTAIKGKYKDSTENLNEAFLITLPDFQKFTQQDVDGQVIQNVHICLLQNSFNYYCLLFCSPFICCPLIINASCLFHRSFSIHFHLLQAIINIFC
jgi:hypothetical protein